MFGLFGTKSKLKKLDKKYKRLLKESFELSKTDRAASDQKQAEAQAVLDEMDRIRETKNE